MKPEDAERNRLWLRAIFNRIRPDNDFVDVLSIVREYFPGISDKDAGYIIWNETGWPCFWETSDWETCMRKQLQIAKDIRAEEKKNFYRRMDEQDDN